MTSVRETITVGIPTVDRPDAIARCLDALVRGDVRPDEIIVVDQGFERPALDAVRPWMDGPVPVRYLLQQQRGLSAARNLIIDQARCTIVAVTDDDCVPDTAWLAAIVSAFAGLPRPDAVTGRVLALPPTGDKAFPVSLRTDAHTADYVASTLPWKVGTGANFAARRDLLTDAGGYDERLGAGSPGRAGEDLELLYRLLRGGVRIRYEPGAVVRHECQTRERRISTRWDYGHGVGAVAGMLCRRGDVYGIAILLSWSRAVTRRLMRAVAFRDSFGRHQAVLRARGAICGVRYGWGIGRSAQQRRLASDGVQDEFSVRP